MQESKSVESLKQEIEKLKAQLDDRKSALPMHDATPQQWMAIEELEENNA